jgi:hypothetical protein
VAGWLAGWLTAAGWLAVTDSVQSKKKVFFLNRQQTTAEQQNSSTSGEDCRTSLGPVWYRLQIFPKKICFFLTGAKTSP